MQVKTYGANVERWVSVDLSRLVCLELCLEV
jgi:hypothetical protein